jgi:hypothetical protein
MSYVNLAARLEAHEDTSKQGTGMDWLAHSSASRMLFLFPLAPSAVMP